MMYKITSRYIACDFTFLTVSVGAKNVQNVQDTGPCTFGLAIGPPALMK